MPDMREGDLGTTACYLTVERLALQAGVESPFWDGASLLMGGCGLSSSDTAGAFLMMTDGAGAPRPCSRM